MSDADVINRFVEDAASFCTLVDRHESLTTSDFIHGCASTLAALYRSALDLALLQVQSDKDVVQEGMRHEEWRSVYSSLGERLSNRGLYWEVFDPRQDTDIVAGDLADDLADIYRDVKNGLVIYHNSYCEEAVWQWTFDFRIHWGDHLVDALRLLHRLITQDTSVRPVTS